jgi:soluble lytic murein transglycosylase
MQPSTHLLLVCASALYMTLACMRAGTTPAAETATAPPTPSALSEAAEPIVLSPAEQTEEALANVRRADAAGRAQGGELAQLTPQEHMRRAAIYHANRAFEEARQHWRAVMARYPEDANAPQALFLIGRSLFQERRYEEALQNFERLGAEFINTPAGQEGFYYVAATKLRLGRPAEAAERYAEYANRFPNGERIEAAHLNAIDAYREADRPDDAIPWVARTRQRFAGMSAEFNALHARLRLDVSRGDWQSAVRTSDELSRMSFERGVAATRAEVSYLRAYSLERSGRKEQAAAAYQSIPDSLNSYFGWLATSRLREMGGAARKAAEDREERVRAEAVRAAGNYPAPFRESLLRSVKGRSVDPRLMLAIMRQESGFNPRAKSGAGARGLLQLTVDAAARYAPAVGLKNVRDEELYRPEVNLPLAAAYIDELLHMFPGLPEAVAASYNGGEDNVARWVKRAGQKDNGVFTSEVGFAESKDYVLKVLPNLRAYKILYDDKLLRK